MERSSDYRVKLMVNRHFHDLNPIFVGSETCLAGQSYGPAVRKYTLIHYVVRGKGMVYKQGNAYPVHGGEAFLIHPQEIVTYTADEHDPWQYQWVAFDGELSKKFTELPVVIPFPSGLIGEMDDCMQKDLGEYYVAGLLFRMYAELFASKSTKNHYVRQVQDYIRALYMNPIRVEQIAVQVGLDRRYLSRIFKDKVGMTVQDYIINVRMEEAKRCLEQGFSVDRSAIMCGYENTSNFSKMFKRRYGISPKQWQTERTK